jgi:hypothetical protein
MSAMMSVVTLWMVRAGIGDAVARDDIDQGLLYSLGAFLTVCQIRRNNAEARIRALLAVPPGTAAAESRPANPTTVIEPDETTDAIVDLGQIGHDQIRRRLGERFKGHELARLITELLKADGFVCDTSPPGPDGGVDILAGEGASRPPCHATDGPEEGSACPRSSGFRVVRSELSMPVLRRPPGPTTLRFRLGAQLALRVSGERGDR